MSNQLETVVIGAGPGGYAAAIRAAQYGKNVTIIEKEHIGGVCLNVGCIPTKALVTGSEQYDDAVRRNEMFGINAEDVTIDWEKLQDWKDNTVISQMTNGVELLLGKNKVDIIEGEATFIDNNTISVNGEEYTFETAIVATGKHIGEVEGFTYGDRVLDTTTALNIKEKPESIIMTGAGYLGSQFAGIFARFGSKVTVLDQGKDFLPGFEKDINRTVLAKFEDYDFEFISEAKATSAKETDNGVVVTYEVNGEEKTVEADYVLVDARQIPNTANIGLENTDVVINDRGRIEVDGNFETAAENIYAIGDCASGYSAAQAYQQAKTVAAIITGNEKPKGTLSPSTLISSLEVATVGMTKAQAKAAGHKVLNKKFLFSANGRAVSLGKDEGFIRIIADKEDHTIYGAQMVGPKATDLIAELTVAIELGAKLEDIAETIHAHPTLAEAQMDAAELALGLPIHS